MGFVLGSASLNISNCFYGTISLAVSSAENIRMSKGVTPNGFRGDQVRGYSFRSRQTENRWPKLGLG
jgi:hypothetical protein